MLKAGVVSLNLAYLWDFLATWAVRQRDDVRELNPLISALTSVDALFYICFRIGVLLMLNVLIWQVCVEDPAAWRSRWLKVIILVGLILYAIPLQMSIRMLV